MPIVALYEGDHVGSARLIAASGDPGLACTVAELLAKAIDAADGYEEDGIGRARLFALKAIAGGEPSA